MLRANKKTRVSPNKAGLVPELNLGAFEKSALTNKILRINCYKPYEDKPSEDKLSEDKLDEQAICRWNSIKSEQDLALVYDQAISWLVSTILNRVIAL